MARKSNGDIHYYRNGIVKQGEYVQECAICGFVFPKKDMFRHVDTGKLVCPRCNDDDQKDVNK